MVGYGLRLVFGWFADRTGRYWVTSSVGYVINLLAVPALALASNWPVAAALVAAERTGRAMRKPPVDSVAYAVQLSPVPCLRTASSPCFWGARWPAASRTPPGSSTTGGASWASDGVTQWIGEGCSTAKGGPLC